MDKEPFLKWDVLADEAPPFDFLTLMQKSQYNAQLVRTFAERKRQQNLLVSELGRLLEPAAEFTKLAIANIETRHLTANVIESWKPIVANATREWARQYTLSTVLEPRRAEPSDPTPDDADASPRIETTREELDAFALVTRLLGDRNVSYTDTVSYFKIHLPERNTWVVCRLYMNRRHPKVWIPLDCAQVQAALPQADVRAPEPGWACIALESPAQLEELGGVLGLAWDQERAEHPAPAMAA